ncbi:hypothetical protein AAFC00_002633 [Neodothiora populina]|uniref:DNA mismatch repair protein S5 domain-containing protein n=1 Tax=Neodothiora populina TaxID=2781224 RepID=A0ABR3P7R2_9PEZI
MSIHPLPKSAVRIIGSSQTLTDPASVVKELIDNAIDARATSISVEISANALDLIQVRDNGHGVAPDDRAMVARRYCTSKITDETSIATLGGLYLGFRGEALNSAAEMSGGLSIVTRVSGEETATMMTIGEDGEVSSYEVASHPTGTTVRITNFLKKHPVRRQIAIKGAANILAKIRLIMQAYAFAKPNVRQSLRVLKAKHDRDNWTYAPRTDAHMSEIAMKIVGRPCASQCAWFDYEHNHVKVQAFVPRVDADISKISNVGPFLSVDCRPVASNKGTFKKIVKTFKEHLKETCQELEVAKDPFIYMNITCPEGSYDPNVEPSKDDVLFADPDIVLAVVRKFFQSILTTTEEPRRQPEEPSTIQQSAEVGCELQLAAKLAGNVRNLDTTQDETPERLYRERNDNMYDLDPDDLAFITSVADGSEAQIDHNDEETLHSSDAGPSSSNPWIMAKINGRTGRSLGGHKQQAQLMTPSKDAVDTNHSSGLFVEGDSMRFSPSIHRHPPTPEASSPALHAFSGNRQGLRVDIASDVPQPFQISRSAARVPEDGPPDRSLRYIVSTSAHESPQQMVILDQASEDHESQGLSLDQIPDAPQQKHSSIRKAQQVHDKRKKQARVDPERDAWFPVPELTRSARKTRSQDGNPGSTKWNSASEPLGLSPPPNNSDIRSFIGPRRLAAGSSPSHPSEELLYEPDENMDPRVLLASKGNVDFVSASKLSLDDAATQQHAPHPLSSLRQAKRRKTYENAFPAPNDRRTLATSVTAEDDSNHSPTLLRPFMTATTHQQATNKPHRIKSSYLPLETTPADHHVQSLLFLSPTSITSLARSSVLLNTNPASAQESPAWNSPASAYCSAFEARYLYDAVLDKWTTRLHVLLQRKFPEYEMMGDLGRSVGEALQGAGGRD